MENEPVAKDCPSQKVLITGVAGLLGCHYSRYLISKGYTVSGIDNLSGGYKENLSKDLKNFYPIDLVDQEQVSKIFKKEKPDYVVHFAAYAAEGLSPFIKNFNYQNNVISYTNVINGCLNNDVKKIIFTSSMSVYGHGNPPFKEDQQQAPIDSYGIAKYSVEQDLKCTWEQFGQPYTIIRPHNIVGVYQNIHDRYRNVIGIFMRRIINKEPILIYGDGLQQRAFSDVQYYMEPFEKLFYLYNNEIFNLGADKHYSILEAATILKEIAEERGFKPTIEHRDPRHEVKVAYCNHDKAKKLLNFVDKTDLKSLLAGMFDWALTQPNRKIKNMKYEHTRNLYSYWK